MEKYQVLQIIKEDSCGKFFLAVDKVNNQKVALKTMLLPKKNTAYWLEQYKKECQILAHMQHPNVIKSYDFFVKNNYAVIVMEYVEGIPFTEFLRGLSCYSFCEQIEMAMQIVSSIAAVSEFGIVHQGISPNSFVVRLSDRRIKLIDAGVISRSDYRSPESLQGKMAANSDVYSLGAVLYIFFGHAIYPHRNFLSEVNATKDFPHLAQAYSPENVQKICSLLQNALEKNPQNRLQNVSLFKKYLKEIYKEASSNKAKISKTIKKRLNAPIVPKPDYSDDDIKPNKTTRNKNKKKWIGALIIVILISIFLVQRHSNNLNKQKEAKAITHFQNSFILYQQQKYVSANEYNNKALSLVQKPEFLIQKAFIVYQCRTNNEEASLANELVQKVLPQLRKKKTVFSWYALGHIYRYGIGVEKDLDKSLDYYKKAMKLNHVPSILEAGDVLEEMKNYLQAVNFYKKAITFKNADAFQRLSLLHIQKKIAKPSMYQVEIWLKKGASLGSGQSMNGLGFFYFQGLGGVKDVPQAISWLEKAVKHGSLVANYNLGQFYLNGSYVSQDTKKGLAYLTYAAENGDERAAYVLGQAYFEGKVLPKDYIEAFNWFLQAAYKENMQAIGRLGDLYYYGYGVQQNFSLALEYYTKSAEENYLPAIHGLGIMYSNANGVEKDMNKSVRLFMKAANLGYFDSMYVLGMLAEKGLIQAANTDNRTLAILWYQKALRKGDSRAKAALQRLQYKK
ncbi:protein kinase [Candidatus Uabimicrobium sp. HlEnr_7]|uniref:protein kinase domain-containing protein n=1 Tax=Candidatus Uabimicrobium helgolandensis TaxID=3095367 RepID=UPI003556E78F